MRCRSLLLACTLLPLLPPRAFAQSCITESGSPCDLHGTLQVLTVIAIVLAVILTGVIGVAVHVWRKNNHSDSDQ